MTAMAKLILKMAKKEAREHDRIMKAIKAAHKAWESKS